MAPTIVSAALDGLAIVPALLAVRSFNEQAALMRANRSTLGELELRFRPHFFSAWLVSRLREQFLINLQGTQIRRRLPHVLLMAALKLFSSTGRASHCWPESSRRQPAIRQEKSRNYRHGNGGCDGL